MVEQFGTRRYEKGGCGDVQTSCSLHGLFFQNTFFRWAAQQNLDQNLDLVCGRITLA